MTPIINTAIVPARQSALRIFCMEQKDVDNFETEQVTD